MYDAIPLSITLEDAHKLLLHAKDVSLLANTSEDAQELICVFKNYFMHTKPIFSNSKT